MNPMRGVLNPAMLRRSMAMVGAMGCGSALLWLLPSPPFSAVFAASAALSGLAHLGGWLLFPRFNRKRLFYISLYTISKTGKDLFCIF